MEPSKRYPGWSGGLRCPFLSCAPGCSFLATLEVSKEEVPAPESCEASRFMPQLCPLAPSLMGHMVILEPQLPRHKTEDAAAKSCQWPVEAGFEISGVGSYPEVFGTSSSSPL